MSPKAGEAAHFLGLAALVQVSFKNKIHPIDFEQALGFDMQRFLVPCLQTGGSVSIGLHEMRYIIPKSLLTIHKHLPLYMTTIQPYLDCTGSQHCVDEATPTSWMQHRMFDARSTVTCEIRIEGYIR